MAYATGDSSKTARLERHKDRTLVIVNDSFGNIRTIALVNLLFNFYRATLCASAVFAVVRCPSVTLVHCIHTADDIVKLRVLPGSPIILVFFTPSDDTQIPRGTPTGGAQNTRGCENYAIVDRNRRLSRKRYEKNNEIGPWLPIAMEH